MWVWRLEVVMGGGVVKERLKGIVEIEVVVLVVVVGVVER